MTAFTDNLASDNILVADKQDDTAMDTSVQLDNNTATTSAAVDYSSYDPMLISELDDPPHTSPPTTTTTTAEPVQRVLPVKTYGHSKEIASYSRKTHVKSDTTRVPVFKGVFYWINPLMTRPLRDELHELLQTNGGIDTSHKHSHESTNIEGEEEDRLFNTQFSLTRTTHCISWDYDFPEYEEVIARDIHIVTPTWVQRAIRNGYTHRPEYYLPDADHFLSGIVVTTSQIPDMDRDAIFGGVEAFGGQWQEKMVKEVTHLVALTPGGPRYESAMQHPELGIKVVLPHWLDDCFRLRRRIPEHQYLFPNPPLLQHHPWLSVSSEVNTPLNSNTETTETTAIDHLNNTSPSDPQCLLGYRIYLADDLKLADETVTLLEKRINEAGGQLCKEYTSDQVDIVICRWRTSRAYQQAIMSNKIVGTLNWLFHLLITHRLESSTNQLLHYPPPKHGMPDMRHFIITISNYSGMAREYLKRLIILCGAQYTAEMTRRNTHVICAEPQGQKYVAATEWNIIIVNHLWLEESYRAWQVQSVTRPHYTHFPVGSSLLEIVGQTGYRPIDLEPWRVKARTHQIDEASDAVVEHPAAADTITEIPPSNQEDNHQYNGPSSRLSSYQRRQSALEANARLSDLVQSMNEFEREMRRAYRQRIQAKRHPPTTASSTTTTSTLSKVRKESDSPTSSTTASTTTAHNSKRVKLTPHRRMVIEEEEEGEEESNMKSTDKDITVTANTSLQQSIIASKRNVCILTTGVKLSPTDVKDITRLGGKLVGDARYCTHLIAKSAARTEKFLSALARACPIVTYNWLTKSIEEGHFIDVDPYILQDTKAEQMHGFKLSESLARAAKQPLFTDKVFVVTASVHPDAATLARIIDIAGGKSRIFDNSEQNTLELDDIASLSSDTIVISGPGDQSLWRLFQERKNGPALAIYTSEYILTGLQRQQLDQMEAFRLA